MNEQEFLCIIRHKERKVQKRILSILSSKFEIKNQVRKELSKDEKVKLFGISLSNPKRFEQEPDSIILLIYGNVEEIRDVIGLNESPCKSDIQSIQYRYGESKEELKTYYWDTSTHINKKNLFFADSAKVHVAGLLD